MLTILTTFCNYNVQQRKSHWCDCPKTLESQFQFSCLIESLPHRTGQDRTGPSPLGSLINHRRSWNYRYFLRNGLGLSQSVSIPQDGTSAQSVRGSTEGIHAPGWLPKCCLERTGLHPRQESSSSHSFPCPPVNRSYAKHVCGEEAVANSQLLWRILHYGKHAGTLQRCGPFLVLPDSKHRIQTGNLSFSSENSEPPALGSSNFFPTFPLPFVFSSPRLLCRLCLEFLQFQLSCESQVQMYRCCNTYQGTFSQEKLWNPLIQFILKS